ncbi:MAG: GTP cyclohydrolase I, partial [Acidobacteriota bacterium]|nr:GTP cyclohydrolase I [Acidobacteriota bacterium]
MSERHGLSVPPRLREDRVTPGGPDEEYGSPELPEQWQSSDPPALPVSPMLTEKLASIAYHVRGILQALGLDLADPNLAETDRRVAKMYIEMFHGLDEGAEPKVTTFPNEEGYSHMVMEKQIPFYSMCAHHLVPFYGHAHIAYIPRDRI